MADVLYRPMGKTGCEACDNHDVPISRTMQDAQAIHRGLHAVGRELMAPFMRAAEVTVDWLARRWPRRG